MLLHQKWYQTSLENILGEEGEKQDLLVRLTKYFKDDGKLKCTDFYLNSLDYLKNNGGLKCPNCSESD